MTARLFAGHTAQEANRFRAEALDRIATWAAFDARMRELLKPYRSRSGLVIEHTACRDGDSRRCEACVYENREETE